MNRIKFGNSVIQYDVKRSSHRKTSQIFVSKSGVKLIVPTETSNKRIKEIMVDNIEWIFKKQVLANNQFNIKPTFKNNTKLFYLGKQYLLKITKSTKENVVLSHGIFLINTKYISPNYISKLFKRWLSVRANVFITNRLLFLSKNMDIKFKKLNIKDQKGRWGSISDDGSININLCIMCAPSNIIDYVLVHELCHFKIPKHSAKYWNLLEKIMPDYASRKHWLDLNWRLLDF